MEKRKERKKKKKQEEGEDDEYEESEDEEVSDFVPPSSTNILHYLAKAVLMDVSAVYLNTSNSDIIFSFVGELEDEIGEGNPDLNILSAYLFIVGQQMDGLKNFEKV